MPHLHLKSLDCGNQKFAKDFTRLKISTDGQECLTIKDSFKRGDRSVLSAVCAFQNIVEIELRIAASKLASGTLLGTEKITSQAAHRGKVEWNKEFLGITTYLYTLWFEIIPDDVDPVDFHADALMKNLSLRNVLGRTGHGALPEALFNELIGDGGFKYRCSEVISVQDIFALHTAQDGGKGQTTSLKTWIRRHCNPWGEESVIPIADLPEGGTLEELRTEPNWQPVEDEQSRVLAGFMVDHGHFPKFDSPFVHATKDWNWDIIPSPAFQYMLAYTTRTTKGMIPVSHNEWESGSMPVEWRPQISGVYITMVGRHVYDLGHLPMKTEMHPIHTIVMERTFEAMRAGAPAVNKAVIGMGLSGGFPGQGNDDEMQQDWWNTAFGGFLVSGRQRRCYVTNLKQHPLKIKLFPPDPRPGPEADLDCQVTTCQIAQVGAEQLNGFLKLLRFSVVLDEVEETWFPPQAFFVDKGFILDTNPPEPLRPRKTKRENYFEIEIDLSTAENIPVAYYAVVDCFWKEPG